MLGDAAARGTFVSLVLSGARPGADMPDRQDARLIERDGVIALQWSQRHGRQMHHENLDVDASCNRLELLLGPVYRNAVLRLTDAEHTARITKRGQLQTSRKSVSLPVVSTRHDRAPQHLLPEGTPCPFLEAIGVMTADGHVRAPQQHKFRQINRYLEFVHDILPELPAEGRLEVVDCGCGKSGLTFALRHYLDRGLRPRRADRRPRLERRRAGDLPQHRESAGADRPRVPVGRHRLVHAAGDGDLVVSLHACDTATDDALARRFAGTPT